MRNVRVLKVYNLVDIKGNKLQLRLGILRNRDDEVCISNADGGYRWSFVGRKIPMPVRSLTWFNGFPEEIMLDWLKGNGWYPQTCVDMDCGIARVYELPKGDEEDIHIHPIRDGQDEKHFCETIRDLVNDGRIIRATHLYRYANGGKFDDAYRAVKEIHNNA